jgi:hypothetical protein
MVLIAGVTGAWGDTGLFFVPALVVGGAKLWDERS